MGSHAVDPAATMVVAVMRDSSSSASSYICASTEAWHATTLSCSPCTVTLAASMATASSETMVGSLRIACRAVTV
jgi:hypothetical protein